MADFGLIGGVGIMGFISPKDTNDTYAVIDPLYGVDGLRNVALLSDLDTITPERRRTGMVVGISGSTYYKLKPEPWNYTISDWELFFVGITGGTFSNYTLTLNSNDGSSIVITGLTDFYVTGATWDSNSNRLELYRNDGISVGDYINSFSGLTVQNTLSATTIESNSLVTNSFQLTSTGNTTGYLLSSDSQGNSSWISEQDLTLWTLVVTGNKLLNGGASYVSGLTFSITPLTYIINGVIYYTYSSTTVTLNSGDLVYDRIDVIVADISGNTGVVQGTPSANPEKPDIDESTQVEVTFVSVPANSSTPDIDLVLIYDENTGPPTEWTFSTNNATRIKGNSTNQSYSGTKSIEVSGVTSTTSTITLTPSSQFDTSQYSTLQFAIKNRIANNTTNQLRFSFLNVGGTQIGNLVIMNAANTAGYIQYSSSNTSTWQLISIPLWKFGLTNTVINSLRIQFVNTSTNQSNLFIDKIQLVEGIVDAPPTNSWLNVKGDTTAIITAPSPNATLTISGGNNLNSRATGTSLIIDLDNNISLTGVTATNLNVSGTTTTNNFRFTKTPVSGYALISSDNSGNANWSPLTISAVTNLQSSLNSKTDLTLFGSHTANTNNPHQTTFFNLISTAHTHTINDVTNLQSSLDGKFNKTGGVVNGNVVINGNVDILGTATTINTQTLTVTDNVITLNSNYTGGTPFFGHSGIEVLRGSGTTAALLWEEQRSQWEAGLHGTTQKIILSGDSLSLLNSGHTHPISDIINLQSSLNNKFDKSGGTINGNVSLIGSLTATTFYGDGSQLSGIVTDNFYVTGGTFSAGTLTLVRQNGTVVVTGFTSVDTFATGFTYSNNNLTITRNQNQSGLTVNISTMTGLTINGNLTVTGNTSLRNFTGTSAVISGTGQNILTVIGSGTATSSPIFTIQGSSGELFSVSDSLQGSLFSVNDISGLPILEVFSDNTTLMGSYLAPSLNTTVRNSLTAGTNTIYSIPTSAYTGAFFDYTLISSAGARAGNIMSIFSGTTVQFTEVTTNDIGNTTPVTFSMSVSSGLARLSSSATTTGWTLKTIVRSI